MKKTKLFEEEKIQKLNKKLKEMGTNKARFFLREEVNKKPHCNVLTSIARLLSTREVCGCFHLKNGKLYFSTNKETKNGDFRQEIGNAIENLVVNGFKEKDKIFLYRKSFKDAIKATGKRYENDLQEVKLFRDKVMNKDDWENISMKEVEDLIESLRNFLEISKKDKAKTVACVQILIRLTDIEIICNDLEKNFQLASKIKKDFFNRYKSTDNLHCELAAIERESEITDLENITIELALKTKEKEFTVSKFCCYLCYLSFHSLAEAFNERNKDKKVDFHYLGNSSTIFPGCISPNININEFSLDFKKRLNDRIDEIIRDIDNKNYKIENQSTIENNELAIYEYSFENSQYTC